MVCMGNEREITGDGTHRASNFLYGHHNIVHTIISLCSYRVNGKCRLKYNAPVFLFVNYTNCK